MRLSRTVAAMATGTLVAGGAVVAAAAPAAAADYGTQLTGQIYMLANAGGFATNSASDVVTSGNGTVRPFQSLQLDTACPDGTAAIQVYVQIPKSGAPRVDWDATALTALGTVKDDKGRFMTGRGDTMARATVVTYLATQPGNTGTLPLDVVCMGANAGEVYGYFETTLTATGTSRDDFTWSVPAQTGAYPGSGTQAAAETTTTLAGAVSGKDVVLTATVSPTAAAGTVTFKDGDATLGTAAVQGGVASYTVTAPAVGAHSYSAVFAPTDAAAYKASSGTYTVELGIDAKSGQLVLAVPAAPVVDGALTLSVPFDTPVQLAGSRSTDNSRITATAAFPSVTVTDTRRDGLLSHWQVNAQSTDFTGTGGTVGAKYLGWVPASSATADSGSPLVTRNGASVPSFLDDSTTAGLGVSRMLGESATPGRGVAKLGAALNLAIPATTAEGQYTATVTVTLVSD